MTYILPFIGRFIFFGLIWLVLGGGATSDLVLAVGVVAFSAVVSIWLWRPGSVRLRLIPLVKFVPYFLWLSVLGGWDVAKRAFTPALPLRPGTIKLELTGSLPSHRISLAWLLSLLPGTVSVMLVDKTLTLHVLDLEVCHRERIALLENRIASIISASVR